eukprot:COSAG04_NODE_24210_length_325_cov_0.907080_1_plen_62_part_01
MGAYIFAVLAQDGAHHLVAQPEREVGLRVVDEGIAEIVRRVIEEEPHEHHQALLINLAHEAR